MLITSCLSFLPEKWYLACLVHFNWHEASKWTFNKQNVHQVYIYVLYQGYAAGKKWSSNFLGKLFLIWVECPSQVNYSSIPCFMFSWTQTVRIALSTNISNGEKEKIWVKLTLVCWTSYQKWCIMLLILHRSK